MELQPWVVELLGNGATQEWLVARVDILVVSGA